jgi:hypothetical protein
VIYLRHDSLLPAPLPLLPLPLLPLPLPVGDMLRRAGDAHSLTLPLLILLFSSLPALLLRAPLLLLLRLSAGGREVRCDAPLAADVAADVAGGSVRGGRPLSAAAIASRPPSSSSCLCVRQ